MLIHVSSSFVAVALVLAACTEERDGKSSLPPPTGPGSPPLPALPAHPEPAAAKAATASERRSTGTLSPHAEVTVVARTSGVLAELTVDVGARVKKGQVLFRIDGRDAALRLAQARLQLAAAEQQLRSTELEHRRTQLLFDQQSATPQQWEQVNGRLADAQLGVAQARNGVAAAGTAADAATARAPIDGVVVSRSVAAGDYVSDMPPTRVVVLQDQATLDLRFRLPERALASVRPGDSITVSLPALGVSRKAAILIVAPSVDPRTRTVELTAVLDNRDGALRPGLMADVELDAAPVSALRSP